MNQTYFSDSKQTSDGDTPQSKERVNIPESPLIRERLNKISQEHARKQEALNEAARRGIPPVILDTITPREMIDQGIKKVIGGTAIDIAEDLILNLHDPASEIATDYLTARATEHLLNRKLRTSLSAQVIHKVGHIPQTARWLSKATGGNEAGLFGFVGKLENKIGGVSEVVHNRLAKLFTIYGINFIPLVQGLVSETSIDGFKDIYEGSQALKRGEDKILIERKNPTNTSFRFPNSRPI